MIAALQTYLLRLITAALLVAVAVAITPEGRVKRVVRFAGGLLLAALLLRPAGEMDFTAMSRAIARVQMEYNENATGIRAASSQVQSAIISQQTQAYILSKAESMGLALQVSVETRIDGVYPYPWTVTLTGPVSAGEKEVLARYIEENLAIPEERQTWNSPQERPGFQS